MPTRHVFDARSYLFFQCANATKVTTHETYLFRLAFITLLYFKLRLQRVQYFIIFISMNHSSRNVSQVTILILICIKPSLKYFEL